jgi:CRISPR-associated protein Cmr1
MLPPKLSWEAPTTITVEFEIITPVFGGGVHIDPNRAHLKPIDPVTPIRGAGIRGQLRFWWRAAVGHDFSTVSDLFTKETELWGNASHPGRVSLRVVEQPRLVKPHRVFEQYVTNSGAPGIRPVGRDSDLAYGAFSLQPAQGAPPDARSPGELSVLEGTTKLELVLDPRVEDDDINGVVAAVNTWLAFGGVGGRTRRGFGAVASGNISLNRMRGMTPVCEARIDQLPSLAGAHLRMSPFRSSAIDALRFGLNKLRTFRQGPNLGRNAGQEANRPGRSRWPEADYIRWLTRASSPMHAKPVLQVSKMPRASFGMPIVFHFKDRGDPPDASLSPSRHERMASPLILRPVRLANDNYACIALVLNVPGPTLPLSLKVQRGESIAVRGDLTADEATRISPLAGVTNPLSAFLNYFTS